MSALSDAPTHLQASGRLIAMKKTLFLLPLVLVACAVALKRPIVPVLYAQTLPATVHAHFTPRPATENVTQYSVVLDGGAPVIAQASTACSATDCSVALSVPTFGSHSVTAASQNFLVSTDPTTVQSSTPTAAVAFVLAASPSAPSGTTVKQN